MQPSHEEVASPRLGHRLKTAVGKVGQVLHLPGTGHPVAEHHRVVVEPVAADSGPPRQWDVAGAALQPGGSGAPGQLSAAGVAAPDTPVGRPASGPTRPAAATEAAEAQKEGRPARAAGPTTAAAPEEESPFSTPPAESPAEGQSPPHSREGSHISIERATESQDIYVEELEPLVAGSGVKRAEKKKEGGEEHTDAGPAPWARRRTEEEAAEVLPEQQPAEASAKPPWAHEEGCAGLAGPATPPAPAPPAMMPPLLPTSEEVEQAMVEEREEGEEEAGGVAAPRRRGAAPERAETAEEIEEVGATAAAGPREMTAPFESPSGKVVIPPVEVPAGLVVPRRRDAGRALAGSVTAWVRANPVLAAVLALGAGGLGSAGWAAAGALLAALPSPLRDFGPALLVSGAVALVASALAWLVRSGGLVGGHAPVPLGVPAEGVAAAEEAAAAGAASEPVSKESIDDLKAGGGGGGGGEGEGLLARVEHAAEDAAAAVREGVMEKLDPGMEMAGEVVQEPEEGEAAGAGAGAVSGGGSAEPAALHTGTGGYLSDSDVPGAVIEGVHPAGGKPQQQWAGSGPSVGEV